MFAGESALGVESDVSADYIYSRRNLYQCDWHMSVRNPNFDFKLKVTNKDMMAA